MDGIYIEQAKAAGRSTIRCHIYHIAHHSIIELAIRKAAIRVMPQGGKCSYAELVRNTHRCIRPLKAHRMIWCCSPMAVLGVVSALPIPEKATSGGIGQSSRQIPDNHQQVPAAWRGS
jgi:hypothetical protein